jgi:hypothetical protein
MLPYGSGQGIEKELDDTCHTYTQHSDRGKSNGSQTSHVVGKRQAETRLSFSVTRTNTTLILSLIGA